MHPVSLRRRNVGMLFSRKDSLEYVLMRYEISILIFLQTTHPKIYQNFLQAQTAVRPMTYRSLLICTSASFG